MTVAETTSPVDAMRSADALLAEVLSLHFDRKWGTPYWLARAQDLGFDPARDIQTVEDLPRLGLTRPKELCDYPLEHFLPRSFVEEQSAFIVAQTGGTLGHPAWTAYSRDEFEQAFVEPFVAAAKHVGFPESGNWLYAGPSGPHIIGRAADAIAQRVGGRAPFMVDFDSRWARKILLGSFAADRYVRHIVEQCQAIIATQQITTIFTTPTILDSLSDVMTSEQRERIRGVHYGGMAITHDEMKRFQTEVFPSAVHISGYGNTLLGCCLELSASPGRSLNYYPFGRRLVFGVLEDDSVSYASAGREGRLVCTRLDRIMFLANVVERDRVRLVTPPADAPSGFDLLGLEDPTPVLEAQAKAGVAIY